MPKGGGVLSQCRGDAGQRGYSLSKENAPFGTPRERRGVFPSTPDIAGLELEGLHTLRIAQPLAALLPYGCGVPLAGAVLGFRLAETKDERRYKL